jgi:hypothetical protein
MSAFGSGVIFGVVAMAVVVFFAWLPSERTVYDQIIRMLERDRDAARNEAKVFRNLLFPVMARAEGAASEPTPNPQPGPASSRSAAPSKPATPQPPSQPKTVDEIFRMRIPYRDKFKLLMRLNNSKQQKHDALASALAQQKPAQEKTHGTA